MEEKIINSGKIKDRFLMYVEKGDVLPDDMIALVEYMANKKLGALTKMRWKEHTGMAYNSNKRAKCRRMHISNIEFLCTDLVQNGDKKSVNFDGK